MTTNEKHKVEETYQEEKIMADVIMEEIEDALDDMPGEQREVFVYHELEDLSYK